MISLRSLRGRVLVLLLVAVLPIVAVAMLWSVERDLALQRFQDQATASTVEGVTERLNRSTDRAKLLRAVLATEAGDVCGLLARLVGPAGFDAGLLVSDGPNCRTGAIGEGQPDLAPLLEPLRAALDAGDQPGFANDGSPAGRLVIGLRPENDSQGLLVLRFSSAETDRIFDLQAAPFLSGLGLLVGMEPVAERHLETVPRMGWPVAALATSPSPPRGVFASAGQEDNAADVFVAPFDSHGRIFVVGLQALPFLGGVPWRFWASIVELAAILGATIAGALWAIDRSVLRWIGYLRRIAVAHSRGHYSVRAKRLTALPRELGEFGQSLNLMAEDAGRRVAMLRDSSSEKSALLLELHHRVKNNFQVITSLLSLLRLEMPVPRSDEIRFVEEFVRAMALAYRTAYDSGDVTGVILQTLLRSVAEALRDLSGAAPDRLLLQIEDEPIRVDLDTAISLGLYLAVTVPPHLDVIAGNPAGRLAISVRQEVDWLRVAVSGAVLPHADRPPLRRRLRAAYLRQLRASPDPGSGPHETVIRVPLGDDHAAHRLAALSTASAPAGQEAANPPAILDGFGLAAVGAGIMLSNQGTDLRYRWAWGSGLFGQRDGTITGRTDSELLAPTTAAALTRIKLQVLTAGEPSSTVLHLAEPAPEQWIRVDVRPIQDVTGRVGGVFTACHDITPFKAAENHMLVLMRDMAHRSKNILAVTEAVARQTLANADSLEDFGTIFSARLQSLANSHDLLARRETAGAKLRDLVHSQLAPYLPGESPQVEIDGPDLCLTATAIPYLGLALHELSFNAAKHGALSVAEGRIAISWDLHRNADFKEHLRLSWVEAGGPPAAAPKRRDFGTDVTKRILSRALRGQVTLDLAPGGIVWRLDAPADSLIDRGDGGSAAHRPAG
jgi:two-component sensor histidine kinase